MTDLPINSAESKQTEPSTQRLFKLVRRFTNWFWRVTEDSKDLETKPFDGIL